MTLFLMPQTLLEDSATGNMLLYVLTRYSALETNSYIFSEKYVLEFYQVLQRSVFDGLRLVFLFLLLLGRGFKYTQSSA